MDNVTPTIPARKQAFLTAQTNLLSQPLAPSRAWRATNDASDTPIPRRLVDDAVFNLNHAVEQHCRRVYAPQATRNLAEQISSIYIKQMDRREGGPNDVDGGVGKEVDLTSDGTIESLPPSWPLGKEAAARPEDAQSYSESVARLAELSQERQQTQLRLEKLRRLQSIIEPLRTSDAGQGVQENMVTRNGAVEKELERMRTLLERVAGRVDNKIPNASASARSRDAVDMGELRSSRKRAVDDFLADSKVFPG